MKNQICSMFAGLMIAIMTCCPAAAAPKVTLSTSGNVLRIDGKPLFIVSGAMHYFRVPKALWADRLMKMKQAGLNTVETYVAWNYHEPEFGKADYRELDEFIALTQKMGLYIIVRPGPYICAEWAAGGYPEWLIATGAELRTNEARHLAAIQHYYDGVLPAIRKHQITRGGNVILFQIENEYDFFHIASEESRAGLLDFLYNAARQGGIDVPIFTCWTHEARNGNTRLGRNVVDGANFYPRGNLDTVRQALDKLRSEQPNEPMWIPELEGGWFSNAGGMLSTAQGGVDAPEINSLTKFIISQGVTGYNYYMFHGGTNFGYWGARWLTTTYDYYAPIAEWGGLHDKYFDVKAVTDFLREFAPAIIDSKPSTAKVSVKKKAYAPPTGKTLDLNTVQNNVFSELRESSDGEMFLFVNNKTLGVQKLKVTIGLPGGDLVIPAKDSIPFGVNEARFLPINIPLVNGITLGYSTAEISGRTTLGGRTWMVLYDLAGNPGEICLKTKDGTIPIDGDATMETARDSGKIIISYKAKAGDSTILVGNELGFILTDRYRGLRTWWMRSGGMRLPLVSNAYLMRTSDVSETGGSTRVSAELELTPGKTTFSIPAEGKKVDVLVDGKTIESTDGKLVRFEIDTPAPDFKGLSQKITAFKIKADAFDADTAKPIQALLPLDSLGYTKDGLYWYTTKIPHHPEAREYTIRLYSGDGIYVYLNNRIVMTQLEKHSGGYEYSLKIPATEKDATLTILYEAAGRRNGDAPMWEPRGLAMIYRATSDGGKEYLDGFKFAAGIAGVRSKWYAASFDDSQWQTGAAGDWKKQSGMKNYDGFVWYRADFSLPDTPGWEIPLGLKLKANDYALVYVNGRFIGRYWSVGPQEIFYLPKCWLKFGDKQGKNNVAIAVINNGGAGGIQSLEVTPYKEFIARNVKVEIVIK